MVDVFQLANQIHHFPTGVGTARCIAIMGAATEGTIFVNQALILFGKERAGPVRAIRQTIPTRGAESLRGDESLPLGEVGGQSGFFEKATFSQTLAGAFNGTLFQFLVNVLHLKNGFFRGEGLTRAVHKIHGEKVLVSQGHSRGNKTLEKKWQPHAFRVKQGMRFRFMTLFAGCLLAAGSCFADATPSNETKVLLQAFPVGIPLPEQTPGKVKNRADLYAGPEAPYLVQTAEPNLVRIVPKGQGFVVKPILLRSPMSYGLVSPPLVGPVQ